MPSSKNTPSASAGNAGGGGGGQVSHRLRNFFRINSSSSSTTSGDRTLAAPGDDASKQSRGTKFFSNTVGRLRAHTATSEGNQADEAMSPTAHANPYFAHQGMPGLRHHNTGSVPPSPPETPTLKISSPEGTKSGEHATSESKEELARRLRRVASAPNAQGLFKKGGGGSDGERPATAELGKDPLIQSPDSPGTLAMVEAQSEAAKNQSLGPPVSEDTLGALPAPNNNLAFRRTYSSNSIKVRNVEVGPSSFDKIKLIGKGDVGKVYLVREKKSTRLYAMKGMASDGRINQSMLTSHSVKQERDDQAKQNQTSARRAGNPSYQ